MRNLKDEGKPKLFLNIEFSKQMWGVKYIADGMPVSFCFQNNQKKFFPHQNKKLSKILLQRLLFSALRQGHANNVKLVDLSNNGIQFPPFVSSYNLWGLTDTSARHLARAIEVNPNLQVNYWNEVRLSTIMFTAKELWSRWVR